MSLRIVSRVPFKSVTSARMLSTQAHEALSKFQQIMQEYRSQNYAQETMYRFRREVMDAFQHNDRVELKKVEGVLRNIGAEERMTMDELETIFRELGDSQSTMKPDKMKELL